MLSYKIKLSFNLGVAIVLSAVLLILLFMTSGALRSSTHFEHLYTFLLVTNGLAVVILLTLVAINLRHLVKQVQKERAGARLTVRLVSLLVMLSIVPVIIVYYFSLQFLHQRLDSWFDLDVERALTHALDLSRTTLGAKMRESLRQTEAIAEEMSTQNYSITPVYLNDLRSRNEVFELTLLATNGQIVASSSADMAQLLPIFT